MSNDIEWLTIDGNWTKHPVAFCKYHKGVLTAKLMKVHNCKRKKCKRLEYCDFSEEVIDDSGTNQGNS